MEANKTAARQSQIDNLNRMSDFCKNQTRCRRALLLMHFGQVEECKSSAENLACDVCTPIPPHLEENNVIFYFNISLYLDNKLFLFFSKRI